MPERRTRSRTHIWLDTLGDWSWPGRAAPAEALPPPWVPALPPLMEPLPAGAGVLALPGITTRARRMRVLQAALASALLTVCCAIALRERVLDGAFAGRASTAAFASRVSAAPTPGPPLPRLVRVMRDSSGGVVEKASFASAALDGRGAFFVYLPPGFERSGATRYPVLYLLHGRQGHASAFLEIGIQHSLDHLIASGAAPPMIAVMIQDRISLTNWRNVGRRHSESYVVEVQELIDRMLPTIASRAGRAIAGSSMGGYGAMHVALANPTHFAVVESWLGFFNGLEDELRAARPVIAALGLRAFLYGALADPVANPEEDPAFAEQLRAAGATAEGVIYPGGHSLEKVQEHLDLGLEFAGRALLEAQHEAGIAEAHSRWRG